MKITEPGLYDLDAATYHADPVEGGSLSSTGARKLVQTCPEIFHWEQEHPRESTRELDFGSAAHSIVLGVGDPITVIDADDWRGKAAREQRDEARQAGEIPMLRDDYATVRAMAARIREHPIASKLFDPEYGEAEKAAVWQDADTGIWRRALYDWLPSRAIGRRLIVADYKTARSADPVEFGKAAMNFGYHQQDQWYLNGLRTLELDAAPAFVFVVQEKAPPYTVSVLELDQQAREIGDYLNRKAIRIYAECKQSGHWPAYVDSVAPVSLPGWYVRQYEDDISDDIYNRRVA